MLPAFIHLHACCGRGQWLYCIHWSVFDCTDPLVCLSPTNTAVMFVCVQVSCHMLQPKGRVVLLSDDWPSAYRWRRMWSVTDLWHRRLWPWPLCFLPFGHWTVLSFFIVVLINDTLEFYWWSFVHSWLVRATICVTITYLFQRQSVKSTAEL